MSEKTTNLSQNKVTIFWDDAHIEDESLLFPKALQELYRRVKIMCRENYGSDMDQVTEAFAKIGAKRDKTTWSRIFKRGRWKQDAEGNALPSPIVSLDKLRDEFESFLQQTRVELRRGRVPFSETSVWTLISKFVEKKMRPGWVNRFGVITGPTGLQKSASFKEIAARNPRVKHVECESGSIGHLLTLLAYKYGVGLNRSTSEKRFKIYDCFTEDSCIILDNTQDLSAKGLLKDDLQQILKFFRWLQDERGGTIIVSITPEKEDEIFPKESVFMEQFEGRAGGKDGFLRLPNKNPRKDLVIIANDMGLQNAEKHAERLEEIGTLRGRIRTYYDVLQHAKHAADADQAKFTIEYIEEAMEERAPKKEGK